MHKGLDEQFHRDWGGGAFVRGKLIAGEQRTTWGALVRGKLKMGILKLDSCGDKGLQSSEECEESWDKGAGWGGGERRS